MSSSLVTISEKTIPIEVEVEQEDCTSHEIIFSNMSLLGDLNIFCDPYIDHSLMTTQIIFENATIYNYQLFDQDGFLIGQIMANGYYGLRLNYSPTFQKRYFFRNPSNVFSIYLGIDGSISQLIPNNLVHLEIKPEEYTARIQIFPPPLITSNMVTSCCHLCGPFHNKLMITPFNNVFARIVPLIAPPVPDRSLRLDFV
jgi:hypothetical protein